MNYSKYCVYHQYVVLVKDKTNFSKYLEKKNIQFGYHYPKAIHNWMYLRIYFLILSFQIQK